MSTPTKTNRIGRKIARIRELRGMKQEALAIALGGQPADCQQYRK